MPKSVDEITNETIKEGGILALLYIDLHAESEESVKSILVGIVGKLSKEKGVVYALGDIEKPILNEGVYSTSAEIKLLVRSYSILQNICATYAPIGVEILRPNEVRLSLGEAQNALLDVAKSTQDYSRLIMERLMTAEEKEKYLKVLKQREEVGKRLIEKKGE